MSRALFTALQEVAEAASGLWSSMLLCLTEPGESGSHSHALVSRAPCRTTAGASLVLLKVLVTLLVLSFSELTFPYSQDS